MSYTSSIFPTKKTPSINSDEDIVFVNSPPKSLVSHSPPLVSLFNKCFSTHAFSNDTPLRKINPKSKSLVALPQYTSVESCLLNLEKPDHFEIAFARLCDGLLDLFELMYPEKKNLHKVSPLLLSASLKIDIEKADKPLGNPKKSPRERPVSSHDLVWQCLKWFLVQNKLHHIQSPREELAKVPSILKKLATEQLNSIKFILKYHGIHSPEIYYPDLSSNKNSDPLLLLYRDLYLLVSHELQERSKKHKSLSSLVEQPKTDSSFLREADLMDHFLNFISADHRSPEIEFVLSKIHDFSQLVNEEEKKELAQEIALLLPTLNISYTEAKPTILLVALYIVPLPWQPDPSKKFDLDDETQAAIFSFFKRVYQDKKEDLKQDILKLIPKLRLTDQTPTMKIYSTTYYKLPIPKDIFTDVYNEIFELVSNNYLHPSSDNSYWDTREFFAHCFSKNLPNFVNNWGRFVDGLGPRKLLDEKVTIVAKHLSELTLEDKKPISQILGDGDFILEI